MDSTYPFGLLLIALSAFLLAMHWQQWKHYVAEAAAKSIARNADATLDAGANSGRDPRWRDYTVRSLRRRVVASSLVGAVGLMLMLFETVPQKPLPITSYLLCLVLMTCWILWLACLDFLAARRFQEDSQLEKIAAQLRQVDPTAAGPAIDD